MELEIRSSKEKGMHGETCFTLVCCQMIHPTRCSVVSDVVLFLRLHLLVWGKSGASELDSIFSWKHRVRVCRMVSAAPTFNAKTSRFAQRQPLKLVTIRSRSCGRQNLSGAQLSVRRFFRQ